MSRVSSFGHHSAMLQGLLDSQSRLYATQQQINTGKKTTEFRGMARETQTLLGAKSLLTRTQGYIATAREIGQRLDSTELQLETVHKAAEDLKLALTEAVGQGNIADFHAGAGGPLEGNLDPAQRAFLTSEIPNLTAALDKVQTLIAENGLRQNRVEAVTEELDKSATFLEIFVSDIEDVNVAEAITRLNMDQMSLQASFSVISTLSRLSLVNFL
jgi:flagellin-like hook-associated protein FlgL